MASQRFVIFETKIFIKESCNFHFLINDKTDLNSGQLVKVDKTKNHIIHFGVFDASAVNQTIGSKKYQDSNKIIIQEGNRSLLVSSITSVSVSLSTL